MTVGAGCGSTPTRYTRKESFFLQDTSHTFLGRTLEDSLDKKHPSHSRFTPLSSGLDALIGRLVTLQSAEQSVDLQYYIWHNDATGKLLLGALLDAADRGVRVRLLLDDLHQRTSEKVFSILDSHPNIEVRVFNPYMNRTFIFFDAFTRFKEANKRMHNKAFIADNQIAIVGGRNIGDEYFEASEELDFGDIDILTTGPVVKEVSQTFDIFWNHHLSVPLQEIRNNAAKKEQLDQLRQELHDHRTMMEKSDYAQALRETELAIYLRDGGLETYWGKAVTLSDRPDKVFVDEEHDEKSLLANQLSAYISLAKKKLFLISAYFIPGEKATAKVDQAIQKGLSVKILTNSLASTDVSAVHSAYTKYRKDLVQHGAEIYELKGTFKHPLRRKKSSFLGGSSRSGLHGKAYFIDDSLVFIGSMNIDPRSEYLNTEMGIMIESPELVKTLTQDFESRLEQSTYKVRLNDKNEIVWSSIENGEKVHYSSEPDTSVFRRMWVKFISLLFPEKWL